jgi:acetyltransferase-like isoleucine patch superfamily enzyme
MDKIKKFLTLLLPWALRRIVLNKWFGYEIHPSASIGLAWIFPKKLIMGVDCRIDHLTVAVNLERIEMQDYAFIGRSNWITGFEVGTGSKHFKHQPDRNSVLVIGKHSAITKNHHIDCTNEVHIGAYVTIAGYQSQILTHSIDVYENRQDSKPIYIGDYAFVGTNSVLLGGTSLPAYSLLAAKSLLSKSFVEEWKIYAGVPAKPIADLPKTAKYFSRADGFVY